MKSAFQIFAGCIAFVVLVFVLGFLFQGEDFILYRYFAPKQEAVRRQVFEQTKSYNQGYIQELQAMQFQYVQADKSAKAALADIILHRTADYPDAKLPPDLYAFIEQLRNQRNQ
jgi:hypothetical protein